MSEKLTITIIAGHQMGKIFVFEEHDTLLVGRMGDCQICLPEDRQVSRHHFILEVNPPDVRLRDLGSRNGTFINGRKYGGREKHETPEEGAKREYPQIDLQNGDTIQVGKMLLQLAVEAPVEPAILYRQRNRRRANKTDLLPTNRMCNSFRSHTFSKVENTFGL